MPVDQMLLRERISDLDLPMGQYAILGDAALAAHGLMEVEWIDVIVTPDLFRELGERGWATVPGTDGHALASGDVMVSTQPRASNRLLTIDLVNDVEQVSGLPVVKLPIVRQHLASQGASDHVLWRLSLVDGALGVRTTSAVRPAGTHPRSGSSSAHLRGVLTAPRRTFVADRGLSFWWMAFAIGCVSAFLTTLIDVRAGEPGYVVIRTPFLAGIGLLGQRGVTGIARRVCGGETDVSSATASQAAIVTNATSVPLLAITVLLPDSIPTIVLVTLLIGLLVGTVVVAFWLIGYLYSAAFGCSVGRGVVGEIVGMVTLFLAVFAALFVLSALLNA